MTPIKTDPLEARTRELLAREDQERVERAREIALHELEAQQRAEETAAAVTDAHQTLAAIDPRVLDEARRNAAQALEHYAAAIDAWNEKLAAIRTPWLSTPHPDVTTELNGRVTISDATAPRVGLQRAIASLAREVLTAHFPREYVLLDNPTDY